MKTLNFLKIGDVDGWAYSFIAQEQKRYTRHNLSYCKIHSLTSDILRNIDVIYYSSPCLSYNTVCNQLKGIRTKFPKIKIIGAYSGENNYVYPHYDVIVSISAKHLPKIKSFYPNNTPVYFLPESIDTQFFTPEGRNYDKFQVGWVGRPCKVKRPHLLDQLAFPILKQQDWGKEHFTATRTLEPVREYYRNIDSLVVTSSSECMPRVVLEAMACGIPIVSTRVGSLRMVLDEEMLVDVEPENICVSQMNDKLKLLNNSSLLCEKYGRRNRDFVVENFSWEKNQPLWDDFIEYLFDGKYEEMKNITETFNLKFYDLEPCLTPDYKYIPEVKPVILEEPKKVEIVKTNSNDNSEELKNLVTLLNDNSINYYLYKDTCLNVIHNQPISETLYINILDKKDLDKLKNLLSKEYIKLNLKIDINKVEIYKKSNIILCVFNNINIKNTKDFGYGDIFYKVPYPVSNYLELEFGKGWDNVKN